MPGVVDVSQRVFAADCRLPGPLRLCLLALGSFGGPHSQGIFPSVALLATRCGCSERATRNHLRQLRERGLICTQMRSGRTGGQTSHCYQLRLDAGAADALVPSILPETPSHLPPPEREEVFLGQGASCGEATDRTRLAATLLAAPCLASLPEGERRSLVDELLSSPSASFDLELVAELRSEPGQALVSIAHERTASTLSLAESTVLASDSDRQDVPPPRQDAPPGRHDVPERVAGPAPELLHPNLSIERLQKTGESEAPPVELRLSEPEEAIAEVPSLSSRVLSPAEVASLWTTAWQARYRARYVADRHDQERYRWLAQLADEQATERQASLREQGQAPDTTQALAQSYLTLLFAAYLAESGRPTRDGEGYLAWNRHPLRCLEQDLARLPHPWTSRASRRPPVPAVSVPSTTGTSTTAPAMTAAGLSASPPPASSSRSAVPSGRGRLPLPPIVSSEPTPEAARLPPAEVMERLRAMGLFRPLSGESSTALAAPVRSAGRPALGRRQQGAA